MPYQHGNGENPDFNEEEAVLSYRLTEVPPSEEAVKKPQAEPSHPSLTSAPAAQANPEKQGDLPPPDLTRIGDPEQLSQELSELDRRRRDLEMKQRIIDEVIRRRNECENGLGEMRESLAYGREILSEEVIKARRNVKILEETLDSFANALEKINHIDNDWSGDPQAQKEKLDKVLPIIENARMEWNSARVKLPILDGKKPEDATGAKSQKHGDILAEIINLPTDKLLKLGLMLQWPLLVIAVLMGLIFIVQLFK